MVVFAGVEGGGTTWRVALAEGHPSNIVESQSFVTLDDPQEQLKVIKEWLSARKYDSLGIGTFGPIDPTEKVNQTLHIDRTKVSPTTKQCRKREVILETLQKMSPSSDEDMAGGDGGGASNTVDLFDDEGSDGPCCAQAITRGKDQIVMDQCRTSPTYGYITSTPKPGWNMVDVVGALSDGSVPCKFDTDVNAPALAEHMWRANAESETSCAYITIGTGVGVGLVVNGQPVHGLLHPEAGHLCLKRMPGDDFPGVDATFDGASIEGLASTVALAARKGCRREDLPSIPDDDPMWDAVAHTIGGLCASLVLVVSPERIVLSGGVMNRESLYPKVRDWTRKLLNGYIQHPYVTTNAIDNYIVPSSFGQHAGMVGCLTLAHLAYEEAGGRGRGAGPATATPVDSGKSCGACPCPKGKTLVWCLSGVGMFALGAIVALKALKSGK